ncbi:MULTISPECIES: hypothetical protein [Bacillus]|uniref:hypothetical protein n=1 Tax=Bacillus TaxID=1386 RepID=UPI0001A14E42|nr:MULTISPECIES: hypothetical protein [Bacillus]AIK38130.1 hypothetical protein DJ92_665 [Bacillus pseudomycoides]AJI15720.1 hypothetical protein BG07_4269 [Bacillus pseudomycoides]EEM04754.1 hypothetical protein bmyco0002_28630 [Bacillus pseudomycoides]EEM16049.1 hypothetical protein bpmyx0001_31340 [Bacillus pseudomycoides DSM 12442]MCX2828018.1 hypothetical protein [Bacillus sp. DHT2]
MKATKLVSLAIPVLLLVGCGVGDKDSIPKTEETSKAMSKTVISEKQYPYYICEQLVEFQFKKDKILLKLGEASKDNKKYKDVFKTANNMDEALDRMENIIVPDKYKDIHKLVQEGITDARKGTKLIKDADKDDGLKIQEAVLKSSPHMSGVDGEQWREAIYKLNQETKDAYAKALDKKMEEHTK